MLAFLSMYCHASFLPPWDKSFEDRELKAFFFNILYLWTTAIVSPLELSSFFFPSS
jgi:hypothetical protein